jgi:hypothetical protein
VQPLRLQKIDESLIQEHSCLESTDHCYFLGDYTSGQKSQHSETNQLIINLKKPMDRKQLPEWYYKEKAILKAAYWLQSIGIWDKLKICTWIPIPPSKTKDHPEHDDRLLSILKKLKENEESLDIRELLLSKAKRVETLRTTFLA